MNTGDPRPKTKGRNQIDWPTVKRVLVVRLRSIGDTVLATPSLIALKRFLPYAQIDILLEDWVAPVLDGFDSVDNVLTIGKSFSDRLRTAFKIRRRKYDVVFNLHGGPTSTFLTYATGARHRVGYASYRYTFLYTDLLSSSSDFWKQEFTHSAEQQLALLGSVGVPVDDRPKSHLAVTEAALRSIEIRLGADWLKNADFALIHPGTTFQTKQWPVENYADLFENLGVMSFHIIAVGSPAERFILDALQFESAIPVTTFDDLSLPEVTALASKAKLFVGNDSGIAHMAAAVGTPTVVIFGSSNRNHWYPWTDAPSEMVFNEFFCQPCPGYQCKEFGDPKCIKSVSVEQVFAAIDRVLTN